MKAVTRLALPRRHPHRQPGGHHPARAGNAALGGPHRRRGHAALPATCSAPFDIHKPLRQLPRAQRGAPHPGTARPACGRAKNVALITDAGLPSISDPGARLLSACWKRDSLTRSSPGLPHPLTALVGSGFPPIPFYFGGFLPVKSGGREREVLAAIRRSGDVDFLRVAVPAPENAGSLPVARPGKAPLRRPRTDQTI